MILNFQTIGIMQLNIHAIIVEVLFYLYHKTCFQHLFIGENMGYLWSIVGTNLFIFHCICADFTNIRKSPIVGEVQCTTSLELPLQT